MKTWSFALGAACLAWGCGQGEPRPAAQGEPTKPPPAQSDGGRVPSEGGSEGPVDGGSVPGDGGRDTGGGDGGVSFRCDPNLTFSTFTRVPAVPSGGFDRFGGVSANELTIVWSTASGDVYVSDRDKASDAFGPPGRVQTGPIKLAGGHRIAVEPGGLGIIAVAEDRKSLVGLRRPNRGAVWGPAPEVELAPVNAIVSEGGGAFSEPVLGTGGRSLFYLVATGAATTPALFESTFDPGLGSFRPGGALAPAELQPLGPSQRRRPTGASSDALTLFFYDEVTRTQRAAWRASPAAPFTVFKDLSGFDEAAPTRFCDALYFVATDTDAGGKGLFLGEL